MREKRLDCPCKKKSCEHHGDCDACREKHRTKMKKRLPACDRKQLRAAKKKPKETETA